jgi:hypothetical protein
MLLFSAGHASDEKTRYFRHCDTAENDKKWLLLAMCGG